MGIVCVTITCTAINHLTLKQSNPPMPTITRQFLLEAITSILVLIKTSISFNMGKIVGSWESTASKDELGTLVQNGGVYLHRNWKHITNNLGRNCKLASNPRFNTVTEERAGHTHWKYGTGVHWSTARRIIWSRVLVSMPYHCYPVRITHMVLEGSFEWVIGRTVSRNANLDHMQQNCVYFKIGTELETISILDD